MKWIPAVAFFLSGASSLIFQTIWTRMLHHVFGATSVAISTVVTAFMGGLGLGAWLAGRYADRIRKPLLAYALAELCVGLWALLVPVLVNPEGFLASVNAYLRATLGFESTGFMIARFVCVLPILVIPTTLMGATLPLLARHFVRTERTAQAISSRVGVLYALNTLGAVAGTFLAAFVLLPNVGLAWTNAAAMGINVLLAATVFLLRNRLLRTGAEPVGSTASEEPQDTADGTAVVYPRFARRLALAVFALSGASALTYEVAWSRALAMVIGSSIYGFALILMTFLIGIAVGSSFCGASLQGRRGRYDAIRFSEISITLALLLVVNVPWAVQHDVGSWILATLVGFAPTLVAVLAVWLRARSRKTNLFNHSDVLTRAVVLAAPFYTSIANMVMLQGYLTKILGVAVIAVGTFVVLVVALRRFPLLLMATIQLLIGLASFASYAFQDEIPFAFSALVRSVPELPKHIELVQFYMFLTSAICTVPATLGLGAMFPLTLTICSGGPSSVGRDTGTVYTSNTLGSIVGAWLPGFVLFPWLGLERTIVLGIGLNLVLALSTLLLGSAKTPESSDGTALSRPPVWHSVAVYLLAPLVPACGALLYMASLQGSPFRWNLAHMTLGVFRVSSIRDARGPEAWPDADVIFYKDGLSTTVSVERWGESFALKNNGKVDASNGGDMPTQVMVAGFPLLMYPRLTEQPDVAVIGFGSGVTIGTVLQFPVKSVDVIELERSIPAASRFFQSVNRLRYPLREFPYVKMPRLRIYNDDGRNYLASAAKKYDVIISEPSNPWITGVSDLFTTDHFRISKKRLKPGGIYCQWVQLYELSPENIKSIYRTFASQFRYVVAFAAEDLSSDTVLLGSDSPLRLDLDRMHRYFNLPNARKALAPGKVDSPYDVLALLLLGSRSEVERFAQIEHRKYGGLWKEDPQSSNGEPCPASQCRRVAAPLNTDDNALIEFAAPKDLIGYEQHEGYLANLYASDWPYGRLRSGQGPEGADGGGLVVTGLSKGETYARRAAELALTLMGHGRRKEAAEFIEYARMLGDVREIRTALHVLTYLLEDKHEPKVAVEVPNESPALSSHKFMTVRNAVDRKSYGEALVALDRLPQATLDELGPAVHLLRAYLLYKTANGRLSDYENAVTELETLLTEAGSYVNQHPEIYYFLARANEEQFKPSEAVFYMRRYVERTAAN